MMWYSQTIGFSLGLRMRQLQIFAEYQQSQRNLIKLQADMAFHGKISKVLQTKNNKYCKVLPICRVSLIIKVD